MTKIYYNYSEMNLINQKLEVTKNNLKNIVNLFSQINIPYDFKYKTNLNNLKNSIPSDLSKIDSVYNLIKNSTKCFENIKNNTNNNISSIENYQIYLRQSAIK